MVIFYSYVNVYQAGYPLVINLGIGKWWNAMEVLPVELKNHVYLLKSSTLVIYNTWFISPITMVYKSNNYGL